jgi:hypothetical protein
VGHRHARLSVQTGIQHFRRHSFAFREDGIGLNIGQGLHGLWDARGMEGTDHTALVQMGFPLHVEKDPFASEFSVELDGNDWYDGYTEFAMVLGWWGYGVANSAALNKGLFNTMVYRRNRTEAK